MKLIDLNWIKNNYRKLFLDVFSVKKGRTTEKPVNNLTTSKFDLKSRRSYRENTGTGTFGPINYPF